MDIHQELEKQDLEKGITVQVYPVHNELTASQESVVVVDEPPPTAAASAAATGNDSPPPDRTPPLDGGAIAWAQVVAGFLMNAIAWGYPGTFGVYQLYYTETLGMPLTNVSWIGSVQTFLTYFICTLSGRLCDAGYAGPTVLAGSSIVVVGTLITSLTHDYWQIFLTQGIITGVGLGLLTCPPVTLITSYFERRKSFALAVAATGSSAGSVILPAVVQYLLPVVGFGWAIRCVALISLLFGGNAYILMRPCHKPNRSGPWVEWSAFKEPAYLMFTIGTLFIYWALYFGSFFINLFATEIVGFTTTSSVSLLMIVNGLAIPIRPVLGYLADHHAGPINCYVLSTIALGVVFFAWTAVDSRAGMYAFAVFFGLANGASQGAWTSSLASLTTDTSKAGVRFGMVCTLGAFATLAGPPTADAIRAATGGGFLWAQLWAGLVVVLGALIVGIGRWSLTGSKLFVKI